MGDRVAMASRLGLVLALLAACYTAGSQAAIAPATPKSCCRCQKVLNSNKQEFCHKVPRKDEDKCLNEFDDMFLNCKTLLGYDAKPVPPKESNETVKRAVWVPMSGICAAAECDCAQSMNDCAENAKCTTNNAGQSCSCNAGYVGDGHICRSLGSCDSCSPYSTCEELSDDRVQCTCNRGYDGDGVSCTGNGNCDLNNGGCDPSATCRKTSSGRNCTCNSGYSGSGKTCTAVVCLPEFNPCDENADCKDGGGVANCTCSTGYFGNGFNCSEFATVPRLETIFKFSFPYGKISTRAMKDTFSSAVQRDVAEGVDVPIDKVEVVEVFARKVAKKHTPVEGKSSADAKPSAVESKTGVRVLVRSYDQKQIVDADITWRSLSQLVGRDFDVMVQVASTDTKVFVPCLQDNGGCAPVDAGGNCSRGAAAGEVSCECAQGYTGDGLNCTALNPCLVNVGGCHPSAVCTMVAPGKSACLCQKGFAMNGAGECKEIDNCKKKHGGCDQNAFCTKTGPGENTCECNEGYVGDGAHCVVINQCALNNGGCDWNANCSMKGKNVQCACNDGYEGTGSLCTEMNECKVNNGGCNAHAFCQHTGLKTNKCMCNAGYHGDGLACVEIDSCAACHEDATCMIVGPGMSICRCKNGFSGNGFLCRRVHKPTSQTCEENNGGCDSNADCELADGKVTCKCQDGYEGDGKSCTEVSPSETNPCGTDQMCVHTGFKKFECKCRVGTERVAPSKKPPCPPGKDNKKAEEDDKPKAPKQNCTEINGCDVDNGRCHDMAVCMSLGRGMTDCRCVKNFIYVNHTFCEPQNNCKVQNGDCDKNAQCTMTGPGTNRCACKAGFSGDGRICDPINPCTLDTLGNCSGQATCKYMGPGKHKCVCNPGFSGSGFSCEEYDPCDTDHGGCSKQATCKDRGLGMNSCKCNTGYKGDGTECKAINLCLPGGGVSANVSATPVKLCHENGSCVFMGPGRHECRCRDGFKGNGVTECKEIDVCDPYLKACSAYATCKRGESDLALCACNKGYSGDGKVCAYINKCASSSACSSDATCHNSGPGAALCHCNMGFKGDGKLCEAVTPACTAAERAKARCHKNAACTKLVNGPDAPAELQGQVNPQPVCKCERGYTGTGKWCEEVNPCRRSDYGKCNRETQQCMFMGHGNHRCECLYGHTPDGDCEDASEHPRVMFKLQVNLTNVTWVVANPGKFRSLVHWDVAEALGVVDPDKAQSALKMQNVRGNQTTLGGKTAISFEVVAPLELQAAIPEQVPLPRFFGSYYGNWDDAFNDFKAKTLGMFKAAPMPLDTDTTALKNQTLVPDDCANGCAVQGTELEPTWVEVKRGQQKRSKTELDADPNAPREEIPSGPRDPSSIQHKPVAVEPMEGEIKGDVDSGF